MHVHVCCLGMTSSPPPTLGRPPVGRPDPALRVVFLDGLDVSMVGVALPSIQADLGLTTSQLQWVVSAYVLGLGGLLLLGGRAADLLGRRRVLIAALAVFTVASLVGGLVDDGTLLIAARFLKGVAAAFTVPAALSLITTTFTEGPARNKALAIFNAFGASGFSFGLVFGGLLTSVGWRLTFLLPVPVAAILLALIPRYIAMTALPRRQAPLRHPRRRAADRRHARCSCARSSRRPRPAGVPPRRWRLRALRRPARRLRGGRAPDAQPLVRLGIFRSGPLVRANLGAMCLFGAYVGFQFVGHPVPAGHARLERARDRAGVPAGRPARRLRRPAHGRGDQPLRHDQPILASTHRLRRRLRALPAGGRDALLARRSCRRCC